MDLEYGSMPASAEVIRQDDILDHPFVVGAPNLRLATITDDEEPQPLDGLYWNPAAGEVTHRQQSGSRYPDVDHRWFTTRDGADFAIMARDSVRLAWLTNDDDGAVHVETPTINRYGYSNTVHYAYSNAAESDPLILRYAFSYADGYELEPRSFGDVTRSDLESAMRWCENYLPGFQRDTLMGEFIGGDTTYQRLVALVVGSSSFDETSRDERASWPVFSL